MPGLVRRCEVKTTALLMLAAIRLAPYPPELPNPTETAMAFKDNVVSRRNRAARDGF